MWCHVMSCHVMSCHVMSCHVMSCHVMSCWCRYMLRVTVTRGYGGSITKDFFFWVRNYSPAPPPNNQPPIKARAATTHTPSSVPSSTQMIYILASH
jgi:hypothetical protein